MGSTDDRDRTIAESHLELEERVRRRAHEIWISHRGEGRNTELDDWLQAEREVLGGRSDIAAQNRATVVGDARAPGPRAVEQLRKA